MDKGIFADRVGVETFETAPGRPDAEHRLEDTVRWQPLWRVEEWDSEDAYRTGEPPVRVAEFAGNLLLNEGITEALELITATGTTTAFNNASARIGVGDSVTAAAATQTDLQAAANKTYKGMMAGFPSVTDQTATWKAEFLGAEANYAWEEFVVDNGATAAVTLNRKVQAEGTKVSGQVRTVEVRITLS